MNHSIRLFCTTLLLVMAGLVTSVSAQDTTRYAFVNKERTMIFVNQKNNDLAELRDTLFLPNPSLKFRGERLAVLGSTRDGKALLVGGKIFFAAFGSGFQDSMQGFFRIPIPFNPASFLTEAKVLRRVYDDAAKILPLGVITPDDKNWYGIWQSAGAGGPVIKLYHGNFEIGGSTVVDSAVFPVANKVESGFHTSNLSTSDDGSQMLFVMLDQLTSGVGINRARLVKWVIGATQPLNFRDITGQMDPLLKPTSAYETDDAFAFAFRAFGNGDQVKVQLATVTEADAATGTSDQITVYEAPAGDVKFNNAVGSINRSALPDNLTFFTGFTGNADDVFSEAPQQGNGGDMMFSRDGRSLIYVVHEGEENGGIRNASSAIYMTDMNSGQTTLLHNNLASQERQPVFLDGTGIIQSGPEVRGSLTVSPLSIVITDSVLIGQSVTRRVTITQASATSSMPVQINSVALPLAQNFAITGNSLGLTPPYAFTLNEGQSAWFDITFAPTAKQQYDAVLLVAFETDSLRSVLIRGFGKEETNIESVDRDYTEVFTLGVAPNPFSSASIVTIKGVETSDAMLELVDVNGKAVWTASTKLSAGSTSSFDLNGATLAAGSYYLIVRAANVQTVRQVVIAK